MREKEFESLFTQACILYKCLYVKIPDVIAGQALIDSQSNSGRFMARKRPADGVFVSREGVMLIELKANAGAVKPHQISCAETANAICPGSYLFIRSRKSKGKEVFQVEVHDRFGKLIIEQFSDLRSLVYGLVEYQHKLKALNMKINLDSNPAGNKVES